MAANIEKLRENLLNLQEVSYTDPQEARIVDAQAHNALMNIFYAETATRTPSSEERQAVAEKLVKAIKPIKINIEGLDFQYFKRLHTSVLMKRSAIQFLLERYSDIEVPSAKCKLEKVFKDNDLAESVEILDGIIARTKGMHDSDDPDSDRETSNVPSSHSWWF